MKNNASYFLSQSPLPRVIFKISKPTRPRFRNSCFFFWSYGACGCVDFHFSWPILQASYSQALLVLPWLLNKIGRSIGCRMVEDGLTWSQPLHCWWCTRALYKRNMYFRMVTAIFLLNQPLMPRLSIFAFKWSNACTWTTFSSHRPFRVFCFWLLFPTGAVILQMPLNFEQELNKKP